MCGDEAQVGGVRGAPVRVSSVVASTVEVAVLRDLAERGTAVHQAETQEHVVT